MARPQKFRHQREDLSDPKIAEKLGRFVIEIEDLRAQKSKIDELLAAAFDAVDDSGFEKKYVRKVIALRAKEDGVRRDEEDGLESYEFAIEKGVSLARTRRKPANDQFDPITGEFIDDNEASDGSPSVSSELTTRLPEGSVVPHSPETAIEQPEAHGSSPCIVAREANRPATYGKLVTAGETAPHSDQPLKGGDEDPRAVGVPTSKTGEGAASALPAKPKHRLRPNCLDRSNCKSGSVDHCWSCKKAMAEKSEVAA